MLKFETKNALLGILELEFLKTIFIFEFSTLKFVKLRNFVKNENT